MKLTIEITLPDVIDNGRVYPAPFDSFGSVLRQLAADEFNTTHWPTKEGHGIIRYAGNGLVGTWKLTKEKNQMKEKLAALRDKVLAEIEHERLHLIDIGGPSGMRNSQASAMGLARNTVRAEFAAEIDSILREELHASNS